MAKAAASTPSTDPPAVEQSPPAAAETAPPPITAPPAGGGVFEYIGEMPTILLPRGLPPQSAEKGDICELGWDPGDDRWVRSTKTITRWPDNDPRSGAPEPVTADEVTKQIEEAAQLREQAAQAEAAVTAAETPEEA